MNIIGIIPARMASSRLPGKPLKKIREIPMLAHVFFRSKMSSAVDEIYVATCDKEIDDYINRLGGKVVMTSDSHERATDRTAEAMLKIEEDIGKKVDIVVMIQGDEPMLSPAMLEEAIAPMLEDRSIQVVNLMASIETQEEHADPNEVKVVVDLNSDALYFSREPIPSWKKGAVSVPMLKQVCIIPFRRDFLLKFNRLPPTPLEQIESVDMMRVLEHGYKVRMVRTQTKSFSVDTIDDLKRVEQEMLKDLLLEKYIHLLSENSVVW